MITLWFIFTLLVYAFSRKTFRESMRIGCISLLIFVVSVVVFVLVFSFFAGMK